MSGRSDPTRRAWSWQARLIAFGVAVVLLALLPLVADPLTNQTLSRILVFSVAILGLNIVMGYTGQVNLGQVFFIGLGAYATALTLDSEFADFLGPQAIGLTLTVAFVFAVVLPGAAGLLIALAAVRLRGLALALVTIALPIVGVPLIKRFTPSEGISARFIPKQDAFPYQDQIQYWIILGVATVVFVLAYFLVRGKFGRAFAIVRSNEAVASSMGISPYRYKVLAFTIASIYGGVAGFLYIVAIQFVSPDVMGFGHSIELVIASVVGGAGSIVGALFGGIFYVLVPQLTNAWGLSNYTVLVQGVVILLVLFVLPGGLASLARVIRTARRGRKGSHAGPGDAGPASATPPNHPEREAIQ